MPDIVKNLSRFANITTCSNLVYAEQVKTFLTWCMLPYQIQ